MLFIPLFPNDKASLYTQLAIIVVRLAKRLSKTVEKIGMSSFVTYMSNIFIEYLLNISIKSCSPDRMSKIR